MNLSSHNRPLAALFSLGLVLSLFAIAVRNTQTESSDDSDTHKPIPVRPDTEPYEPYRFLYTTDQSIKVYRDRCLRDPEDYSSRTTLASFYIRRAKENGDLKDVDRAEVLIDEALKLLPSYEPAHVGKMTILNAKHKFDEALKMADLLLEKSGRSGDHAAEALVAKCDALLELGQVESASQVLQELIQSLGKPTPAALVARQARIAELKGETAAAIELLNQAREQENEEGAPRTTLSWYASRVGDIQLSQGHLSGAQASIERAIAEHPDSPAYKVLLARVRMAQGQPLLAVNILEELLKPDRELEAFVQKINENPSGQGTAQSINQSLLINQNYDTYLLLCEAYQEADRETDARQLHELIDKKVNREPPIAVRELVLHYCDGGRRLEFALELAKREAKVRNDVFTCDTLAWALFHSGQFREAEAASLQALRLGTRDALLFYHAGVIADQLGRTEEARNHLKRCQEINPHLPRRIQSVIKRILGK